MQSSEKRNEIELYLPVKNKEPSEGSVLFCLENIHKDFRWSELVVDIPFS
jgi:hypothetical protein